MADRANAAKAARNKTTDTGHMPGGWPHAQRLASLGHGLFNIVHAGASLGAHAAFLHVQDTAHLGHVDHDAAFQRHTLAVVAGAASAHGQWQLVLGGYARHLAYIVFIGHLHHQLGQAVFELLGQDGAVPVKVFRGLLALAGRCQQVQTLQVLLHGGPVNRLAACSHACHGVML